MRFSDLDESNPRQGEAIRFVTESRGKEEEEEEKVSAVFFSLFFSFPSSLASISREMFDLCLHAQSP